MFEKKNKWKLSKLNAIWHIISSLQTNKQTNIHIYDCIDDAEYPWRKKQLLKQ